jgi:hypothetical protein
MTIVATFSLRSWPACCGLLPAALRFRNSTSPRRRPSDGTRRTPFFPLKTIDAPDPSGNRGQRLSRPLFPDRLVSGGPSSRVEPPSGFPCPLSSLSRRSREVGPTRQPAPDASVQVKSALSPDAEEPADPSCYPDVVHGKAAAHSVTIDATEDCWIECRADGWLTRGVMLTRGKRSSPVQRSLLGVWQRPG